MSTLSLYNCGTTKQKLLKQIQRSFKIVIQCKQTWEEVLTRCKPHIDSVNNLTEQLTCCDQASDASLLSLSTSLPDIKDRLKYKLQSEIDRVLTQLNSEMTVLQDLCEKLAAQHHYSTNLFIKNSQNLDIESVTMATATTPSISSMLQWLQEIEQIFHQRLCARKFLLDQYSATDTSTYFQGSSIWAKNDQDIFRTIDDHLAYLTFFMEEKF